MRSKTTALPVTTGFLALNHASRYICRYIFLALLMLYILNTGHSQGYVNLHWILSVGAAYAILLAVMWAAAGWRPQSDASYAGLLLLDLAALGLALPYDPTPACPAMIAMLLMVLDNGFRGEARFYVTALLCAMLVGAAVVLMRAWIFNNQYAQDTAWTLLFVLTCAVYGYFLFQAFTAVRRRLGAMFVLADTSEDLIFAVTGLQYDLSSSNHAMRALAVPGVRLLEVFAAQPADASKFITEAIQKGQAKREWKLRNHNRMFEIKARPLPDQSGIACIGRDISQHHQRAERLFVQTRSDALTDIPNRRAFDRYLVEQWRHGLRARQMLGVLMIDIDYFKAYNDKFGHAAGDQCLKRIAKILRNNLLRPGDFAARYGGEEFAVIAPNCDRAGVQAIAQRLVNLVAAEKIPHPASPVRYVTISVGAAAQRPEPTQKARDLLRAADVALYQAKKFGRNRVVAAP